MDICMTIKFFNISRLEMDFIELSAGERTAAESILEWVWGFDEAYTMLRFIIGEDRKRDFSNR